MRMFGTAVHLELAVHRAAERILRQHALDGDFDDALRMRCQQVLETHGLQVADVAGEAVVHLVVQLGASDGNLLRVDHDDIIASVDVRSELGLMLAAQTAGDLGRQTTERLVRCINHEPIALDAFRLGAERFHFRIPSLPPPGRYT